MPHEPPHESPRDPAREPLGTPARESIEALAALEGRLERERRRDRRLAGWLVGGLSHGSYPLALIAVLAAWIGYNTLAPAVWRFDPPPFSRLGVTFAALGTLTTALLLIRSADIARSERERTHLALHVLILAERKMSRMIELQRLVLERGGVAREDVDSTMAEWLRDNTLDDAVETIRARLPRGR